MFANFETLCHFQLFFQKVINPLENAQYLFKSLIINVLFVSRCTDIECPEFNENGRIIHNMNRVQLKQNSKVQWVKCIKFFLLVKVFR